MVLQFVGFLAASRQLPQMHPIAAGVAGSVVTVWATFAPCFLFVLAGAPLAEWLRGRRALNGALTGIMAAVVGVILNLAVWFSLHVLFARPCPSKPARFGWNYRGSIRSIWPRWPSRREQRSQPSGSESGC